MRARSNYVSSLKSYHLFPLWHYTVDNFLFLFLFLVMAARYSIEQEYYNLFNGHYGCLEFLLLSLKGLSIILFIFLLDFRIIKRQRHRIQIQKSNVTSITNLSRLWRTWLKCESQMSLLVRSLPPPSECNLNPKIQVTPKARVHPMIKSW